jgi:hypothetical protein
VGGRCLKAGFDANWCICVVAVGPTGAVCQERGGGGAYDAHIYM